LGETGADHLSMTLNAGYALSSVIFIALFLITLGFQLSARRFNPLIYWLVFTATSVAGTTISDFMDRTLGLGYATGSLILLALLWITLTAWYYREASLSVTAIETRQGEIFYWTAFLIANTLGTALGDFLADSSGLGFAGGAILISSLLVLTLAAHYLTRISSVVLFWIAFVLTRPFGATFGDLLTKPTAHGGLGLGTMGTSVVLIMLLVVFVMKSRHKLNRTRPDATAVAER
ncbi:MAG: hypothetical protein PHQ27_07745, partial [Victivallales bacterium]|nr:hypothetical protein [Victivallales bacterium]